jgi:RES domain-containing protein
VTLAWRIDKVKRSKTDSFSGEGAAIEGGRWNQPGTRMVYSAETLSLAAMEKFVHMGDEGRSVQLVSYRIDIPAAVRVETLKRSELPKDWKSSPAPQSTMAIGSNWVQKSRSAVLKVPSVVIDTEHNYLLNPLHADFKRLRIHPAEPFSLDPRMWKKEIF